ncbi:MAG: glycoside hydrolase [Bacteroidales bacterium]|nr:glycoside hydrolase [Bacteroidales bacterium]
MTKRLLAFILALLPLTALAEDLVLENEHARIVFDGGNEFRIKSFVMDGVDIAASQTTHPWELELIGPNGENPVVKPWMADYGGGYVRYETAHFSWRLLLKGSNEYMVLMSVTLDKDMELPQFHCDAILPKGWTVSMAEFPRIAVRRPEGAKVILPVGYGTRYDAPVSNWLHSEYPSCTGSMQMTMMNSPEGTVFFSTRDEDASQKVFFIGGEGDACIFLQKTIASYEWTDELGIFQIPWAAVMGFTREGWEQTALKWYRPWALTTKWGRNSLAERQIAPWILKSDVWVRPVGIEPETVKSLKACLKYYGKGTGVHWYQWHHNAYDTNYPDYFPAKDGFKELVAEVQKLGGHVTPYINGRLWDTANHTYAELGGAQASCRRRDGTLYTEIYGSRVPNTVTCPSTATWQNIVRELNQKLLDSLGVDGVYIDQVGAAKGEACYAENHPHSPGGGEWWHLSYRKMLQQIRREVYTPDKAMTTEENAECYIDLFDMMLVVNSPHNSWTEMVPLFPLIYSDRCVYSGFTYFPETLNDGSFDYMTMKSLLWGSQLGWIWPNSILKSENAEQAAFLKDMGKFRRGAHDVFEGGQFLGEFIPGGDNPVKDIPGYQKTPVVMGATWLNTKGRKVYLLVNIDSVDHRVSLPDGRLVVSKARQAKKL